MSETDLSLGSLVLLQASSLSLGSLLPSLLNSSLDALVLLVEAGSLLVVLGLSLVGGRHLRERLGTASSELLSLGTEGLGHRHGSRTGSLVELLRLLLQASDDLGPFAHSLLRLGGGMFDRRHFLDEFELCIHVLESLRRLGACAKSDQRKSEHGAHEKLHVICSMNVSSSKSPH